MQIGINILILAWQCLQVYGLYLFLVAIHEAGHHLAGAFVGYRWKGWIVGPFQVLREGEEVRVSL